jgi:hypothetical protein
MCLKFCTSNSYFRYISQPMNKIDNCKGKSTISSLALIKHHDMEAHEGAEVWLHTFLIPALDEVRVNFTTRPLCPQGKSPQYPLSRKLGWPQNRSERFIVEANHLPRWNRNLAPRRAQCIA